MQVTDAMVAKALEAYHATDDFLADKMRAALTAALAEMWRPVNAPADLPQDGMYLAANDHNQVAMIEVRNGYRIVHNMPGFVDWAPVCNLTHFMPLPTPPKTGG